ncbi:HAMP domain-containing histidine kinase [Synechococcus sp. J7-Johnson]|uniref:sensor histidine kinase n=1 Tax=Synechococcus sp. J7-Johnson TaxID=2823737 RepID=UPI0020CEA3E6|nr:HAMP domain-containing sensor histidine kinase [Synechococcus sp. J7-Johnson]MCP9840161.1 HAMP domain-containing histidine kinase [Synechococcus sp. J7-Johnson]
MSAAVGQVSVMTLAVALLEFVTPQDIVFGTLYVIPMLRLGTTASARTLWAYALLVCVLTLLNLVLPPPVTLEGPVVVNRLLVCGALLVTAGQCLRVQALQRQRLDLQARLSVEDLRSDFVATLAHDLKTPILGTIATTKLLGEQQRPDGALLSRAISTIERGQTRALRQIQTLLEVYGNDAEGLRLSLEHLDLSQLVEEVINEVSALAQERQLTIRLTFMGSGQRQAHTLVADPVQLRRMIENLLLNAIHHSLRGGQILVTLASLGSAHRLQVIDHGPGVPEQELPNLFQRFHRLSADRQGSGLGLYLCRQIVSAHGGTISLRNRTGGGAVIEVDLPILAKDD